MKTSIDTMVDRFLAWQLPKSVCSDLCVTDSNYPHSRSGTNLLTATEARAMLEHVLGGEVETTGEGPFVVADNAEHPRFRTMKQGFPQWTMDVGEALQFARKKDAEAFSTEDEDAWHIYPVSRFTVKTSSPQSDKCEHGIPRRFCTAVHET